MSQLFLSHSSKDNTQALALHDWLLSEGWSDLFLDISPDRGIVAGERWERALHQAASRCDAVLFLVSSNWLGSEWCLREFELAHRLNKQIFGLLIEDLPIEELPSRLSESWQLVNLASGKDHQRFDVTHPHTGEEGYAYFSAAGLKSLRNGLQRAGLDPRHFEWPPANDPERPPYRGLRPLEADDAGIFFGREAPTIELLSRLRGLRERSAPRLLVILGASGAGKSSFLRAGILPRLSREDRHFLPLPVLRPETSAITGEHGVLNTLVEFFKPLKLARGTVRDALVQPKQLTDWLVQRIKAEAHDPDGPIHDLPTLVLAIDQAEELFLGEGKEEADQALALLSDLARRDELPLIVLFTIRSDSYDYLQRARSLEGTTQETFSLGPMPKGAYTEVIQGPAKRLAGTDRKLAVEPALTERLLGELERGGGSDALPLLAFTLERLYREYGDCGDLTLEEYDKLGGIRGSIEAATEEVFASALKDPALPNDRGALEALARRALIPWLTGIDAETLAPRRRVARMREVPEEARPLVQHMVEQRLLTTDRNDDGEITVEPAHEALLRQWGLLKGWLEEDLAALAALEGVQRATRDWLANDRSAEWLSHTAGRLEEAETVSQRADLKTFVQAEEQRYLQVCRKAYNERTRKELEDAKALAKAQSLAVEQQRRAVKRTRVGLAAAICLTVVASVLGMTALQQTTLAERSEAQALNTQSRFLADLSTQALSSGEPNTALLLALNAFPGAIGGERPETHEARIAIERAAFLQHEQYRVPYYEQLRSARYLEAAGFLVVLDWRGFARIVNAQTGDPIRTFSRNDDRRPWGMGIGGIDVSEDGRLAVLLPVTNDFHRHAEARVWEIEGDQELHLLQHESSVTQAVFSPSGDGLVTVSESGKLRLWSMASGTLIAETTLETTSGIGEPLFLDEERVLLTTDREILVWTFAEPVAISFALPPHKGFRSSFPVAQHEAVVVLTHNGDGEPSSVTALDYNDGSLLWRYDPGCELNVRAAGITPNQEFLVLNCWLEERLRKLSISDGAVVEELFIDAPMASMRVASNESIFVTGLENMDTYLFSLKRSKREAEIAGTATGALIFRGGQLLASDDGNGSVVVSKLHSARLVHQNWDGIRASGSIPEEGLYWVHESKHGGGDTVTVGNIASGEIVDSWMVNDDLEQVHVSVDGELFVSMTNRGSAYIMRRGERRIRRYRPKNIYTYDHDISIARGNHQIAFAHDELLTIVNVDGDVLLQKEMGGRLSDVQFLGDGSSLLVLERGVDAVTTSSLLSIPDGTVVFEQELGSHTIGIAVSAAGFLIACGYDAVHVQDLSRNVVRTIALDVSVSPDSCALSDSGRLLAMQILNESRVLIMDLEAEGVQAELDSSISHPNLRFGPHNRRLYLFRDEWVSGQANGVLDVFDAKSGLNMARFSEHHSIERITFNDDGSRMLLQTRTELLSVRAPVFHEEVLANSSKFLRKDMSCLSDVEREAAFLVALSVEERRRRRCVR